jgi:photosystem II stability/assembly factor-like uncharacterized protein
VERVILKALAKDPDDRFQTVSKVVHAFDAAVRLAQAETAREIPYGTTKAGAEMPAIAYPQAQEVRALRAGQKRWIWAAAGAILLLALTLLLRRVPIQVRIQGGRLEVVRVVDRTATSEALPSATPQVTATAAVAKATTYPSPQPTATLTTTSTSMSDPPATHTPTATVPPASATSLPPPDGNWQQIVDLPRRINSLVVDPTDPHVLYAATGMHGSGGSGVYKSQDAGLTWQLAVNGLPNEAVNALAFSQDTPPKLYAAVGPGGDIYATTDGAQSWMHVGTNPELCCNFGRQIAVSPSNGNVLFIVQVSGAGSASCSRDGGQNWLLIQDERGTISARSLVIDPTDTDVVYLGTEGSGVYKSVDGGETWSPANRGMLDLHITALAVDPARPQTVYAGGDRGELFKTTDGGQTWIDFAAKLPPSEHSYVGDIASIAIDPAAPDTLYLLVKRRGVLVSHDGGERWRIIGKPAEVERPAFTTMTIAFRPQLLLVAAIGDEGGWRYATD